MRLNQFATRKNTHESESTKIKMNKKCILCGEEFTAVWQIVFHVCKDIQEAE